MSRGGNSGGGQSSLWYLFGSSSEQLTAPPAIKQPPAYSPPYGVDTFTDARPSGLLNSPKPDVLSQNNNNYRRAEGQNAGNFITDRPSTKVRSPPGGDSSLGYLFGDISKKN